MEAQAPTKPLAVTVTSRDAVVRHGLRSIIAEDPGVEAVTAEPADLATICQEVPDAVVVDETLTSEEVTALVQACRVIVTVASATDVAVLDAFAAGAAGVVLRSDVTASLAEAVAAVADGKTYIDPGVAHVLVERAVARLTPAGPFGLTVREQRILTVLDHTNRQIGADLGIAPETVKSHVRNLMRKLGAQDRRHAAQIARQNGLD